jgi:hypothetical protein
VEVNVMNGWALFLKLLTWAVAGMIGIRVFMKAYPDPHECPVLLLFCALVLFGPVVWAIVILEAIANLLFEEY